jgi:hypothetical protein
VVENCFYRCTGEANNTSARTFFLAGAIVARLREKANGVWPKKIHPFAKAKVHSGCAAANRGLGLSEGKR